MDIHVVRAGETVSSVAARYGVPAGILAGVNGVAPDATLAVGQTLVVRHPRELHTVASGESVYSIALRYGLSVRTLYQNNPALGGRSALYPGQTLVIAYDDAPLRTLAVNAYSYPFIRGGLLDAAAQAPYYHYTDRGGCEHAVWFEDARSIEAKLRLADEYHLQGVGYWNLTRPFPQNWAVLASLFDIETLL